VVCNLRSCNYVFNNISTHTHLCLYQHLPHPTYNAWFYFLVFPILSSRWIANPSLFWQPHRNSLSKYMISNLFFHQNMVHFAHFPPPLTGLMNFVKPLHILTIIWFGTIFKSIYVYSIDIFFEFGIYPYPADILKWIYLPILVVTFK
jgi:hypothetical protein